MCDYYHYPSIHPSIIIIIICQPTKHHHHHHHHRHRRCRCHPNQHLNLYKPIKTCNYFIIIIINFDVLRTIILFFKVFSIPVFFSTVYFGHFLKKCFENYYFILKKKNKKRTKISHSQPDSLDNLEYLAGFFSVLSTFLICSMWTFKKIIFLIWQFEHSKQTKPFTIVSQNGGKLSSQQ